MCREPDPLPPVPWRAWLLLLIALGAMVWLAGCGHDPTGPTHQTRTCVDRPTDAPVASTCE